MESNPSDIATQRIDKVEFDDQFRFEVELEFVQCLSNVYYLKYLKNRGYFDDERFRAYLFYLQYWRTREYIKYIKYPYCIKILELLMDDDFVKTLSNDLSIESLKFQLNNHCITKIPNLNILKCTLERNLSKNIFTHLVNNGVYIRTGFLHRFDRCFHYIVDDVNYRLDKKYLKRNLDNLDKNIKWLRSLNSLESYIGTENNSDESRELLVKLDIFNNVDKIEDECDGELLLKYLEDKCLLVESILDYIPNTTKEFRRKHIINNSLIQYVYRLIRKNMDKLSSGILIKYYTVLLEIDVDDINDLLAEMYLGIWKRLEVESMNNDDRMEIKIDLLSRIINKVDKSRIQDKIEDVLISSLCSNVVFYKKIKELTQIVYYTHIKQANTFISGSGIDGGIKNDLFSNYSDNYLDNYVLKLNNYVYLLDNPSIINSLYLLYKLKYVDVEIFNKFAEAIMYRFDTFDYDEMDVLVSVISSYKNLYIMSGVDLGESIYSEGGKMLLSMIRRYFEDKLVNLSLTRMLDTLTSLTMLGKSSNYLKSLVLKKLDSDMMKKSDMLGFSKLLVLLSNLRVNKSNEQVSGLIQNYLCQSDNLLVSTSNNIIDNTNAVVATTLDVSNGKLLDSDVQNILKLLGNFIPKKKYQKYLNNCITEYMEKNVHIDSRTILFFVKLYLDNKLYKYDDKVIGRLLSRLMLSSIETTDNSKAVDGIGSNCIANTSNTNSTDYTQKNLVNINRYTNQIRKFSGNIDDIEKIGIHGLIVVLDGIDKSHISIEKVKYITDIVYGRIYNKIKSTSSWNIKHIQRVLSFMIETRIVNTQLLDYIMEYIHDYFIASLPNESEMETEISRITATKINIYLLYLKASIFLNKRLPEVDVYNIYNNIVYHLNQNTHQYTANEEVMENFKELLTYERYNNGKLYGHIISKLSGEQVDVYSNYSLFKSNTGRSKAILSKQLSNDYISFHQIGDLTFDFYSPILKEGVHILKRKHYYRMEEGEEVYLKNKAHLMQNISQKLGIKLKLIPEHKLVENNVEV